MFEELWFTRYRISGDQVQAKDWARDFLDRHAHALAESLRDAVGREDYPGESERAARYVLGFRDAADLIDPQAASADPSAASADPSAGSPDPEARP